MDVSQCLGMFTTGVLNSRIYNVLICNMDTPESKDRLYEEVIQSPANDVIQVWLVVLTLKLYAHFDRWQSTKMSQFPAIFELM